MHKGPLAKLIEHDPVNCVVERGLQRLSYAWVV